MTFVRLPTGMARPIIAIVAVLASMFGVGAQAGVDAWTTTGPRNAWLAVIGDTSTLGAIRVAGGGRTASSDDLGSTWSVYPPGRTNYEPPYAWPDYRFLDLTPTVRFAYCQDPTTPGRLYYGDDQLSRSDDGGRTWHVLPMALAKPFSTPRYRRIECVGPVQFALLDDFGDMQRSVDGGLTFQAVSRPPTGQPGMFGTYDSLAFDGATLVAGVTMPSLSGGAATRRIQASADLGTTWRPNPFALREGLRARSIVWAGAGRVVALVDEPVPAQASPSLFTYTPWVSNDGGVTFVERAQAAFVAGTGVTLRVDVLGRSRLLAVGPNLLRMSFDGGETWEVPPGWPVGQGLQDATWGPTRSAGLATLVVATSDLGVLVSEDGGQTFLPRNRGLPGTRTGQVTTSVHGGERAVVAGGQRQLSNEDGEFGEAWDTQIRRRGAEGNRWVRGPGVGSFAAAPTEPGKLLSISGRESSDAGETWSDGPDGGGITARFTTLPGVADSPAQWYVSSQFVSGFTRVYDAGTALWRDLPSSVAPSDRYKDVRSLAVAPSDPTVIFVAKGSSPSLQFGSWIGRSTDRGATFQSRMPPASGVGKLVFELWVDPTDAGHLLAVLESGNVLYESFDGAGSWSALPALADAAIVFTVAVDAASAPTKVYAGTDQGVFVRVGNAPNWQQVGESLGMRVNRILIDGPQDRRTLTLATDRGIFELTLDAAAATLPVFRFYNTQTRTHFYTASQAERDHVLATWPQFIPEGIAFHAVQADRTSIGIPVWRFFNTQTGTHFYTASPAERAHVLATWPQFVEEGVVYRALAATEPGTVKLFRFFNTETGAHFTTTEDDERDYVNARLPMFVDEGPTYSVYPAAPSQ